jgi:hypothetical protein
MKPTESQTSHPDNERASQYVVFMRKGRQAAHQCLFFLYDLRALAPHPRSPELQRDAAFALHQIRAIVAGVHIPSRIAARAKEGTLVSPPAAKLAKRAWYQRVRDFVVESDDAFERDAPGHLLELHARLRDRSPDSLATDSPAERAAEGRTRGERAEGAVMAFWAEHIWRRVCSLAPNPDLDPPDSPEREQGAPDVGDGVVSGLIAQFQAFLRVTRPHGLPYLNHWVRKVGIGFVRHLSYLLGTIAVVLAWSAEALRSLLLNQPTRSAWTFLPLLAAPVIPLLVAQLCRLRLDRSAFFRIAFDARPPERGVEPWHESSAIRCQIAFAELTRLGIMAAWTAIALAIVWEHSSRPTARSSCSERCPARFCWRCTGWISGISSIHDPSASRCWC